MGFFTRLSQLIKSNLNDLISRAEDPEKMLEQIIRDMDEQLLEAKKQVAVAIADEKRLERLYQNELQTAQSWEQKAMVAVKATQDDLAKEALLRKREFESLSFEYQEQWEKQAISVKQLKVALKALHHKIEEAKNKKNVLITRKRRAQAMKSIQETVSSLSDTSAFDTFDRMTHRIEQLESEVEATADLNDDISVDVLKQKFAELEKNTASEEELRKLKQRMALPSQERIALITAESSSTEAEPMTEEEIAELDSALEALKKRDIFQQ